MATTHTEVQESPQRFEIEVQELPLHFEEMLTLAVAGSEVILTEHQIPRAILIPLAARVERTPDLPPTTGRGRKLVLPTETVSRQRTPGLHQGSIQTSEDFDAPLPEDFWIGQQ
jgi:antitoxin (DNA-binding transcriptional repressor) of toxin-antitoxin stability system